MTGDSTYLPFFHPQIMDEATPGLELVYVVPVRKPSGAVAMVERLLSLAGEKPVEIIFVIHSFEYDEDDVKQANLNFYWEMENNHRAAFEKAGIRIHLVNYIGLEQKYRNTLFPYIIGMDEARQRLEDAGNLQGVIALLEGSEWVSEHFSHALLKKYSTNPSLTAAYSEREFELLDEELNPEANEALVQEELRQRVQHYLLQKAAYAIPTPLQPYLFSIKVWMYDKVRSQSMPASVTIPELLHQAVQLGGATDLVPEARVRPVLSREPHHTRLMEWLETREEGPKMMGSNAAFKHMGAMIGSMEKFYRASGLDDYQKVIHQLPQPVIACLTEMEFFHSWQHLQSAAANQQQFKRAFFDWLRPARVDAFFQFTAENFNEAAPVDAVARQVLKDQFGLRSKVFDSEQMLHYFRKITQGLQLMSRTDRA